MSSRLGWYVIFAIAEPIGKHIRSGMPKQTFCGCLLGAILGGLPGLISVLLVVPGTLIGAMFGASVAATIWKRPPSMPSTTTLGYVQKVWTYRDGGYSSLTVLLDKAIYFLYDPNEPWEQVLLELQGGTTDHREASFSIPLVDLLRLERKRDDNRYLKVLFRRGSRVKRFEFAFECPSDQQSFVAALGDSLRCRFDRVETEMSFWRATWLPLLCIGAVVSLLLAAMYIAGLDGGPADTVGRQRQDPIVALLNRAGPGLVAAVGALPCMMLLAWLAKRILFPPQLVELIPDPIR